ncbi:hypothetical protein OSCI_3650026 [Kamptonema sp. PCC 6506]|nr:hypothetical protein OSCI_3650026 [Kamptonema sp. PCC 6506]
MVSRRKRRSKKEDGLAVQFHKLTVRINPTEECLYSQLFTYSDLTFNLIKSIYLEQPTFLVDFQLTASKLQGN